MANENEIKLENKYSKTLYFSVILFVLVFVSTIGLYFYNMKLNSNINDLNSKITELDNSLKKVNEDDKVKLYTLIKANTKFLDDYKRISNIPQFIENLKLLSKDYILSFQDFKYSNSVININSNLKNDDISLASEKLSKFI
jgi:cell division protein FtsL